MAATANLFARFSRLIAGTSSADVFRELADAAIDIASADAAAVIEIGDNGRAHVAASRNLSPELGAWNGDIDEVGDLVAVFARPGLVPHIRPMISDGGMSGALVLMCHGELTPDALPVIDALVDLTATMLEKSSRLDALQRTHVELRATQVALAQAEKLRALGEMAAGVAHDLKNVLNPLAMHIQVLERANKNKKSDVVAEEVVEIKEVLRRGVRTIDRLRDYGRKDAESAATSFDLDTVIEEAVAIAKPRLSTCTKAIPRIIVEVGQKPSVVGHREEVVSAVVNLVINAIDALRDRGGNIRVDATTDANGTTLRVSDDGPGMPPEVERRAFEPFFTTKGEGGTGLGLAMVYACMRRHAGSVELTTGEGKGTTFALRFPRAVS